MSKAIEIRGPLIPFTINEDTMEVTIMATNKNKLIEMCLAEGRDFIDKRDNTALINALVKYDSHRKKNQYIQKAKVVFLFDN